MAAVLAALEQSDPGQRFGLLGQHIALGSDALVQNCTRTADTDNREVFVPNQPPSSFPLQSSTKILVWVLCTNHHAPTKFPLCSWSLPLLGH